MTKMSTFDFAMDSFVAVEAPEGTDPETLHEQALEKFKERLRDGDVMLEFMGNPDLDDTPVEYNWVYNTTSQTDDLQNEIRAAFVDAIFLTEDSLPVVLIKATGKRKVVGQKLADVTGYNVYYSRRMEGNCGHGPDEYMFFLGYVYNPEHDDGSMDEWALEYGKVYASPEEAVSNRYNENGDGKVAWPLK